MDRSGRRARRVECADKRREPFRLGRPDAQPATLGTRPPVLPRLIPAQSLPRERIDTMRPAVRRKLRFSNRLVDLRETVGPDRIPRAPLGRHPGLEVGDARNEASRLRLAISEQARGDGRQHDAFRGHQRPFDFTVRAAPARRVRRARRRPNTRSRRRRARSARTRTPGCASATRRPTDASGTKRTPSGASSRSSWRAAPAPTVSVPD